MGGRRRPVLPSIPWTSLPQMPQALTRMRTSRGPTVGSGKFWTSNSLYAVRTSAFIVLSLFPRRVPWDGRGVSSLGTMRLGGRGAGGGGPAGGVLGGGGGHGAALGGGAPGERGALAAGGENRRYL